MPYCVNCGVKQVENKSICHKCWLDPALDYAIINHFLATNKIGSIEKNTRNFSFPGEKASLALSFFVLTLILLVLNIISFGIFILYIVYSLIQLFLTEIKNKKNMIEVSDKNFKELNNLSKLICYRLGIPFSPVYITQSPNYNAYTQGFLKKTWIVLNSAIIEDFTHDEIAFILGHEYAHIRSRHTTWLTIMGPSSNSTKSFFSIITKLCLNFWSLKSEYTADRGGIIAIRDPEVGVNTLIKLCAGSKLISSLKSAELTKVHGNTDNLISKVLELMGTHPFPANRIKQIKKFSQSRTYQIFITFDDFITQNHKNICHNKQK